MALTMHPLAPQNKLDAYMSMEFFYVFEALSCCHIAKPRHIISCTFFTYIPTISVQKMMTYLLLF